jgi:hypothetical protein
MGADEASGILYTPKGEFTNLHRGNKSQFAGQKWKVQIGWQKASTTAINVCLMLVCRLSDHPIRPREHFLRNRNADLLRRFQIDYELELCRLLHRQVARLGAL